MPMLSDKSPVTFNDTLSEAVDVAIIGAGVIGISTAWFLSKAGISVLVCEKGRVAGEQSSRNWGWIRQMGRDEAELPIVTESLNIWESLAAEIIARAAQRGGGYWFYQARFVVSRGE
jgi:glycine/D-amino acid oxidase-like deaminating enzyme